MASSSNSAVRALSLELKNMQEQPVEGFRVSLINDDNLFEWEVAIFGPPATLYEGGYFKAHLKFPSDYPYSPPTVRFMTKVWHPNVYENGDLCISILHPPHDDPQSGELACERWNPTQNVRTILLSVISLLNEPNTSSPANVDASVMYRKWKESLGKEDEYSKIVKKQVELSKLEAEKDCVIVPLTVEDYCIRTAPKTDTDSMADYDYEEFYDMDDSSTETTDEEEEDNEDRRCCLLRKKTEEEDVQSVDMGMGEEVAEETVLGLNPSGGIIGTPGFQSVGLGGMPGSGTMGTSQRHDHDHFNHHHRHQFNHHHHDHRPIRSSFTSSSSYGLCPSGTAPRATMDDNEDSGQG